MTNNCVCAVCTYSSHWKHFTRELYRQRVWYKNVACVRLGNMYVVMYLTVLWIEWLFPGDSWCGWDFDRILECKYDVIKCETMECFLRPGHAAPPGHRCVSLLLGSDHSRADIEMSPLKNLLRATRLWHPDNTIQKTLKDPLYFFCIFTDFPILYIFL